MGFRDKVYEVVRSVPYGKVISYGTVAKLIGAPNCSRQVGWALHKNPSPDTIPCYRVVFKDGTLSSAFAFGGENAQRTLLEKEGVKFDKKGRVKPCFFLK